jgi:predicted ATPase/DNA-binding SARP family transcriptional activator
MPTRARARAESFPASARVPNYLTPPVGRDREIAEVRRLLGTRRLVSLVGAGGSGKTRLAAAVGEAVGSAPDAPVAWIDLTALRDPDLVVEHTACTLGLREHAGATGLGTLAELLGDGSPLLVLDNCEHVVEASARLVDALLRACPSLRILVTTRQALGIAGEKVWPVPPLAVPAGDTPDALGAASVRLFVERAQDAMPDFVLTPENASAVAHICRRLDGLPLALELAAARMRVLSPEQLAGRLDSMLNLLSSGSHVVLPRHRTLRALMDWSYTLLSPEERCLLQRLSVFAGGFTLDAAEAVTAYEPIDPEGVLDLLSGLVDRSLVAVSEEQGEARYALLETVRQYAHERLLEGEDLEELRGRHAGFFVDLAETAEPHVLGGTRGTPWMNRLEREHGNLRAAMGWCGERGTRAEMELRFGAALHWFHFALSHFAESRRRLEHALAVDRSTLPRTRGRALAASGYLAFWMGDHGAVPGPLEEAVQLLREHGAPTDLAFALTGLGTIVGLGGDAGTAARLFGEAEALLGDPARFPPEDFPRALLYAFGSYWRGAVAQAHGDLHTARAAYETSVGVARRFGSHPSIGHPLTALARTLILQGHPEEARACLAEAVPLLLRQEDRWGLLQAAEVGTKLLVMQGQKTVAARLLGAADGLRSDIGAVLAPHEQAERQSLVDELRDALGAEAFDDAREGGAAESAPMILARIVAAPPGAPLEAPVGPVVERGAGFMGDADSGPHPERGLDSAGRGPAQVKDLRVRALGPLEILVDERALGGEAFVSGKPRELLLLLLCHPDGRTREQVGLAFWPEASASQVKNSFHVTLHRLRKALARPEWIQVAGDRYRLDSSLSIDFDVLGFEQGIEALLRRPLTEPDAVAQLRAVLALYRGDFLDGETAGDWHLEVRERLRRCRHDALMALGLFEMSRERFVAAAEAFRVVLGSDRLHEEAGRQLMICLARTGARTEALRLYETLRILLRDELGVGPDEATAALYEELRAGAGGTPPSAPPGAARSRR